MFTYTTKSGVLRIREIGNGYELDHLQTNKTRGMGDGTNYVRHGEDRRLPPRRAERRKHNRMINDIEQNESEWLSAYFSKS